VPDLVSGGLSGPRPLGVNLGIAVLPPLPPADAPSMSILPSAIAQQNKKRPLPSVQPQPPPRVPDPEVRIFKILCLGQVQTILSLILHQQKLAKCSQVKIQFCYWLFSQTLPIFVLSSLVYFGFWSQSGDRVILINMSGANNILLFWSWYFTQDPWLIFSDIWKLLPFGPYIRKLQFITILVGHNKFQIDSIKCLVSVAVRKFSKSHFSN